MSFNIETKCVQSGYMPKNGEPRVVPIVQSTTYKYESSEQMAGSLTFRNRAISTPVSRTRQTTA